MYQDCVFILASGQCTALQHRFCTCEPDKECNFYKSSKDYALDTNGYVIKNEVEKNGKS